MTTPLNLPPEGATPAVKATPAVWQDIQLGSNWKNRKTGAACIVQSTPKGLWDSVKLLHQSGILSSKGVHYFLYDFSPAIQPGNRPVEPSADTGGDPALLDQAHLGEQHQRERG